MPKLFIYVISFFKTKIFRLFIQILKQNAVKFWFYCKFVVIYFCRNLMIVCLNIKDLWVFRLYFTITFRIKLRRVVFSQWWQKGWRSHFLLGLCFPLLILFFFLKVFDKLRNLTFGDNFTEIIPKHMYIISSWIVWDQFMCFHLDN